LTITVISIPKLNKKWSLFKEYLNINSNTTVFSTLLVRICAV